MRVWDLTSRRALQVFPGKGGPVHCVAVSPDGRWLAAGDAGGGLRLWELETGRERALAGHQSGLRSVAFSPDSRHLLSAEAGGLIVQWDVRTGEREFHLRHRHQEEGVAPGVAGTNVPEPIRGTIATYGPDGQTIVSAGQDQWVMIWDVATRRLRDQVQLGTNILGFSINPDGRQLALAEGVARDRDPRPGEASRAPPSPAGSEHPRRHRGVQPGRANARNGRSSGRAGLFDVAERPDPRPVRRPGQYVAILAGLRGGRTHAGDGRR